MEVHGNLLIRITAVCDYAYLVFKVLKSGQTTFRYLCFDKEALLKT